MNLTLTQDELDALLRNDFSAFIECCFTELNPTTPYLHNWHIDLIASKLEAVRQGKIRRLIINIPPRNLKSICASVAFPAWLLGHNPSTQIISISYGQDLSSKLSLDTRNIMRAPWYQAMFPRTRLSRSKSAVHEFATTQQGFRLATSVGGPLTGRGADIIIIDDPLKPDEAISDASRNGTNTWCDNTMYSRLNSKEDGAIVAIMQRLHLDDLVGHILEQDGWEVVSLPAIAERDEVHVIDTPYGTNTVHRRAGEPLHAEREPLAALQKMRHAMGEYNFAGQYQQAPVPQGGALVKLDWLRYYEPQELPAAFDFVVQSWDTASKAAELADYSACTTWGVKRGKCYLLDVWRNKVGYPDLKRAVFELHRRFKPTILLIEDKSSGIPLVQDLAEEGIHGVKACKPEGDKEVRLFTHTATIEGGLLYLPVKAPWLADYVHELTSFPRCRYADQVDSTTQALAWIKERTAVPGIIQYYQDLVDEKRRKEQEQRQ